MNELFQYFQYLKKERKKKEINFRVRNFFDVKMHQMKKFDFLKFENLGFKTSQN
jgi:hypothetical protein